MPTNFAVLLATSFLENSWFKPLFPMIVSQARFVLSLLLFLFIFYQLVWVISPEFVFGTTVWALV
jgi:hypothetical protein